jgi:hypothetical protein
MSLVPNELDIRIAAFISGMVDRDFRAKVIGPGLVVMTDRNKVDRRSLERHLGHEISADRYLGADRKCDASRAYQRGYARDRKDQPHAV